MCYKTLLAIKAPLIKDIVNYLRKTIIKLRNWTLKRRWLTEVLIKLKLSFKLNYLIKWNSRDAT
jgi:hypothetical protein